MIIDTQYMYRCIQLAQKGKGSVSPNPMVGAVVVYDNKIIGEGYHRQYGKAHAEVNAIANVEDKSLLENSTLYVSLEPCSHHGKTPPCAQLIIDSRIPRVVVGCLDPFPQVSGRGIEMLKKAGVKTKVGILEKECLLLNKEFNKAQEAGRPYIYLKWAQSKDGFIDKIRNKPEDKPAAISNDFTQTLVHKLRAEVDAIMVATNTALADNPSLTTRLWYGKNPVRIILDRTLKVPAHYNIYDNTVSTIIFTEVSEAIAPAHNVEYAHVDFDENIFSKMFKILQSRGLNSVMIEGGAKFLQSVIDAGFWDEAIVEICNQEFHTGIEAPLLHHGKIVKECSWQQSKQIYWENIQI